MADADNVFVAVVAVVADVVVVVAVVADVVVAAAAAAVDVQVE